jgi:pyruvate-ferredoxin/flavodoxin oxidoreductase
MRPPVPADAPEFVRSVTGRMIEGKGDTLPVSAIPVDGTWPTGTTQYEKRNIGVHIPVWEPDICIQCATCSFVCPHATIRVKAYDPGLLTGAPSAFKSVEAKGKEMKGLNFTVQVAPEDCTGCGSCVVACPAQKKDAQGNKVPNFKAINMRLQEPLREQEVKNYDFFLSLPETDPSRYSLDTVKGSQFVKPLFEYNGACSGCGETPYLKLLTQLFGDRLYIGNATGCSSIYGGNLPTTPYTTRADGRGPVWSNSLFEDAAEFAFGMRQTVDKFNGQALELMARLAGDGRLAGREALIEAITKADQSKQAGVEAQRGRVEELKKIIAQDGSPEARSLSFLADFLVKKTVWGIGGDGWGYDIGYGGVDQVMASGENVNLLILDT